MITACLKRGRLSQVESAYLLERLGEEGGSVPREALTRLHEILEAEGEVRPGECDWWDDACDRLAPVLVAGGLLTPKRGARRLRPSLGSPYSCYRIVSPCLPESDIERAAALLDVLDPRVWLGSRKLKDDPGFLLDNERALRALSSWLIRRQTTASEVAVRERCYEIWDDEKAFDEGGMRRLLSSVGFDLALLKTHDSRDDEFPTYLAPGEGVVIISENQDMWHSMRWIIERGGLVVGGLRIKGVVKGDGKRVETDGCRAILRFLDSRGVAARASLYIGDIDPEGIAIQQSLEDGAGIRPWSYMYRLMARLHTRRLSEGHGMRPHVAQARTGDIDRFLDDVMGPAAEDARTALLAAARIPQEIVSLETLKGVSDVE